MLESIYIFYGLLFIIAFLYASVGHGGASGYLALMAIYSFTPEIMRPTALLLNLFVSGISFIQFYRGGYFKFSIFLPLALASVPLAFFGGMITLDDQVYKKILGLLLLIPISRILFLKNTLYLENKSSNTYLSLGMGGGIGFLSGLIGIGGGIILSPLLILLKWTDLKQTAAISALFIFVNSFSGLAAQMSTGIHFDSNMIWYVLIAFAGGLCGAFFGARKFKPGLLKYILAGVLLLAVYKLLFATA